MRILYVDIDSQRPDHLSCYGYHRRTSPAIDGIAAKGVRFTNCYTPDAPCLPSRTALYSGRFGIHTGVVGHGGTAAQPKIEGSGRGFQDVFERQGLARQLQGLGFHTAMISPFGQRHAAHWFYAGFNEMHNTGRNGAESAEEVMPVATKWLKENAARDNWYLHLNFWDVHTPYRMPLDYGEPFKDEPLPPWLDDPDLIRRHNLKTGPHCSLDIAMYDDSENPEYPRHPGSITDPAGMRKMIDGYDTAVRYVDDQVAKIVEMLESAGVYEETAIIISGDHGENLGELGIYGEHGTADHATCSIPMIIRWPGGRSGAVDEGLHYNIDLAPALMDLLGGERQPIWDGVSFAAAIQSGADCGREQVVLSQCAHVCQRSVRFGAYLYMRTYHDGFHLFPQEMLYDIVADPHEQHDLANERPDLCREGLWRLMQWHDEQMQKMARTSTNQTDPMWTVIHEGGPTHARIALPGNPGPEGLAKYIKRLEETGRGDGAAALRARYGHILP